MNLQEKLITWSSGIKNSKFIPQGGEILKYIGGEMLMINFKRGDTGEWTTETPEPVFLVSVSEFEPLTGTYRMVYRKRDHEGEEALRITPEGFSWNNPDEEGWMIRFVSYSTHFKMMEEELFYDGLKTRNLPTLSPTELSQFSEGKERKRRLEVLYYIAAIITKENGEILSFRVSEISRVEKRGKKWELGIKDQEGDYMSVPRYLEVNPGEWMCRGFSVNGEVLGDLKIVDLSR